MLETSVTWMILGSAWCCMPGCLESALGALVAPESIVGGAAEGVANAGASGLSAAGLTDPTAYGDSLNDIDRIIANNPDPEARAKLEDLKQQLGDQAAAAPNHQIGPPPIPPPRRRMDGPLKELRYSDALRVVPPGEAVKVPRRITNRPEPLPTSSSIQPLHTNQHVWSMQPVRLQ